MWIKVREPPPSRVGGTARASQSGPQSKSLVRLSPAQVHLGRRRQPKPEYAPPLLLLEEGE